MTPDRKSQLRRLREGLPLDPLMPTAENMHHRCSKCGRWEDKSCRHLCFMSYRACLDSRVISKAVQIREAA